jgi:hypothetical protein
MEFLNQISKLGKSVAKVLLNIQYFFDMSYFRRIERTLAQAALTLSQA